MRMALPNPRRSDLDEPRFGAQFFDGLRPAIAHARPQPTDELVNEAAERSLEGNPALDAFGHEFARGTFGPLLAVAFARSFDHRTERTHAAIYFESPTLIEDLLAWAFRQASEQSADHHRVGTGGNGLGDVA